MKISYLVPADYNPRKLSDKQASDLRASLERFGLADPIVVNVGGGVIGGHQRIKVLADLGIEEADVRVPSRKLNDAEERELNVRLNKNLGDWDWQRLGDFDRDLLLDAGFEEGELMAGLGISGAEYEAVEQERLEALQVYPPESPRLRERVAIHFDSIKDYEKVKKAVGSGKITAEGILGLL